MQRTVSDPIVNRLCQSIIKFVQYGRIDLTLMIDELTRIQRETLAAERADAEDARHLTHVEVRFLAALMGYWRAEAAFTTTKGEPAALPKYGKAQSLEALFKLSVARFGTTDHKLKLDECIDLLLQYEAIDEDGTGTYVQIRDDFSVAGGRGASGHGDEALVILNYVAEFAETLAHNITNPTDRRFQKVARSNNFPLRKLPVLRELMQAQAMGFLHFLDNTMESEEEKESGDAEGAETVRVGAGVYLIVEE